MFQRRSRKLRAVKIDYLKLLKPMQACEFRAPNPPVLKINPFYLDQSSKMPQSVIGNLCVE